MIFNKKKIQLYNGHIVQINLFNIPLFSYGKEKEKIFFKFNLFKKYNKNSKTIFYLKVNGSTWSNFFCLQKWIDIISCINGDYYIICDNKRTQELILEKIKFPDLEIKFIKSDRRTYKKNIKNICSNYWENIGYAHLTPFIHAKKNNIEKFWSIDADDTIIFENTDLLAESLSKISDYANNNNIDIYGYDVYSSVWNGKYWCFGITYVNNPSKVLNIVKNIKDKIWQKKYLHANIDDIFNLDWFFTFLRDNNVLNIKTFSIENVYYCHLGIGFDTLRQFFIVKNKNNPILIYPLYKKFLPEDKNLYEMPMNSETNIFNFNFDEERSKSLLFIAIRNWFEKDYKKYWGINEKNI